MHAIEIPIVSILDEREARDLIARNHVGRVAFSWHDRVDIAPINYVYEAPWIFGRTGAGAKLLTLGHNHWCAFEVDEVQGPFDWESAVAKGPFSPHGSVFASWDLDQAIAALRRIFPSTLAADDPTPERDVIFAIHASEITGRRSVAGGARA